jgi:hypothetical protein
MNRQRKSQGFVRVVLSLHEIFIWCCSNLSWKHPVLRSVPPSRRAIFLLKTFSGPKLFTPEPFTPEFLTPIAPTVLPLSLVSIAGI